MKNNTDHKTIVENTIKAVVLISKQFTEEQRQLPQSVDKLLSQCTQWIKDGNHTNGQVTDEDSLFDKIMETGMEAVRALETIGPRGLGISVFLFSQLKPMSEEQIAYLKNIPK